MNVMTKLLSRKNETAVQFVSAAIGLSSRQFINAAVEAALETLAEQDPNIDAFLKALPELMNNGNS